MPRSFLACVLTSAVLAVQPEPCAGGLVQQFREEPVFWRQLAIGQQLVACGDRSVLSALQSWLTVEDRHIRGNVAFVFAKLGDSRGFDAILEMLGDRSERPVGQGIPSAFSDGRYRYAAQVQADRYYAVHLLGELRDGRAVAALTSLLADVDVNYHAAWALGEIGDGRAVQPLIPLLRDSRPLVRGSALQALKHP